MTGVRNVGASAALQPLGADDDPDFATVAVRLFARTDDGAQVDDPMYASVTVRLERSKLAAVELSAQMSLRLKQTPTGVRREAWERICAQLAEHGIEAAPEDLHVLRFEFVPSDKLRREMTRAWESQQPGPPAR